MTPNIAVIIPAMNEAAAIAQVIADIPSKIAGEIVVVNNNSSDATPEIARLAGATVLDEPRQGYGFDLIMQIVELNYDLAIGSRTVPNSGERVMPLQQLWGNWLATALIKLLFGVRFSDLGPFRAIKFSKLISLDMKDRTYGWPVEMQLKALKGGLRICEVPVSYRKRIGKSKISGTVRGTLMAGYKIISTIIKYR